MNQILSMNQDNPSFGNNYNNYGNNNFNGGNEKKMDIKMVKKIFAFAVIFFGLVMLISGVVGVVTYFSSANNGGAEYPIVSFMQTDNILTLTIQNNAVIDNVEYIWNNGRVAEINGNNSMEITRDISVPEGNNVLQLKITDMNGKVTEMSKSVVGVAIEDTTPPKIELVVVSSKLNIIAKSVSQTELSYLTYKWNNEKEVKIDATGDKTSIETAIDILNGTNTLTVVAVNEKGISDTQEKKFNGVKKPKIDVKKDDTGKYLLVTVTHESNIESVDVTLNNKPIVLTPDHFGKPVVEFKIKLKEQSNTVKITATSVDKSTETFTGTATKEY